MAKLTLSVDDRVVKRAKRYARQRGVSVSEIVQTYLDAVSSPPASSKNQPEPDAPILRSLRGILKGVDVDDYNRYRDAKYR
jgi:antitoxin component of RelBE/YafQ-DinJ toxin-antitoxin module